MIRAIALVSVLALAGCDDRPRLWKQSEIERIADDRAEPSLYETTTQELDEEGLRARIDSLERRLELQSDMIDTLIESRQTTNDEIKILFENDEVSRKNLNYLRGIHGAAPIQSTE